MVHLILTGATGLVGSSVLSHILSLPSGGNITRLSILTRNPTIPLLATPPPPGTPSSNKSTRIEVIEHRDFTTYPPELLERLQGADACIWALGVSQNSVDKDAYVRVTRDFALEAAKAFAGLRTSKPKTKTKNQTETNTNTNTNTETTTNTDIDSDASKFKFIYVSGEGATLTPGPWTPLFGRVKGETEASLLALSKSRPSLAVYSVRPGGVDGHNQPWLWRDILANRRTAFERIYLPVLLAPVRWASGVGLATVWHSPTDELGRVLVEMAVDESRAPFEGPGVDGEGRTLANLALRRLGRAGKDGQNGNGHGQ
ncbi:hypothetical protein A1O3_08502 [Capronia epimyces CBS 606.96]|uniref:NAD(P)-binding domain-containing protein n=1 Tax=Capronia epimyces CBS 606.96 TaxID=1182542 RepID=W9XPV0_9EURO|nr:uncharacterized protein A1O3_08502 [Capronia epimyces CBS 606.96]EXJ79001.1 hypothetical protein A1O3_08502 [Capronia epimyces CBS 606.96]